MISLTLKDTIKVYTISCFDPGGSTFTSFATQYNKRYVHLVNQNENKETLLRLYFHKYNEFGLKC